MDKQQLFLDFARSFGVLMETAMNDLSRSQQHAVVRAFENGASLVAVVVPEPLTVSGMLTFEDSDKPNVELFRIVQPPTIN